MNFLDKIKDFIEKIGKKKFIILCSFVVFSIIIVIIIISIIAISNTSKKNLTASFEHKYLIDYTVGETISNQIYSDIKEVVFDEDERKNAPSKNPVQKNLKEYEFFIITFQEDSFKKRKDLPDKSYETSLSVSDDRTYTIYYRIDDNYGQNYLVLVIKRTDNNNNDHIYIHTNTDDKKAELEEWAKNTFNLNNPILLTKTLQLPKGNYE